MVGAPGSKWSSVNKNIYFSPDIDQSDYDDTRVYSHMATGSMSPMHIGAYFDPGMEFGDWFDTIDLHSREKCEKEFDRPFNGRGIRIVKSHVLSNHIDFLKETFPDCPIVLVHRGDQECLDWWAKCGGFDIKYPNYQYYVNMDSMAEHIKLQNSNILKAWDSYPEWDWMDLGIPRSINTNTDLCLSLGIQLPPSEFYQDYISSDIRVKVI
jgi:hypothetical protein